MLDFFFKKYAPLLFEADEALTETYNAIRAALLPRLPQEGKATPLIGVCPADGARHARELCVNLAASFARLGLRVLLLDADYRTDGIAPLLGVEPRAGLYEGVMKKSAPVPTETKEKGLFFLSRGELTGGPSDFLGRADTWDYMAGLCEQYDMVFVSLPSAKWADAATCAPYTAGMVCAVAPGHDNRARVTVSLKNLSTAGANLLGLVSIR